MAFPKSARCGTAVVVAAAITGLISIESASAQSVADQVRAQMVKRAAGIGETQRRACRDEVARKLGDSKLRIVNFGQEFDLITYVRAGGWPSRDAKPRYQSTLVIMNAGYEKEGATILFGRGKAVCFYNREGGALRFVLSCFPGGDVCQAS